MNITREQLAKLYDQLKEAEAEELHQNITVYANNDWSCAPEGPVRRLKIEIRAWELGAEQVEQVHHGVKIDNRFIVALNTQKWCENFTKWYPYKKLDDLLRVFFA